MGKSLSTYRQRKLLVRNVFLSLFGMIQVFILVMWVQVPYLLDLLTNRPVNALEAIASVAAFVLGFEVSMLGIASVIAFSLVIYWLIGEMQDRKDARKQNG
jgi:uncharacterized membrane protein